MSEVHGSLGTYPKIEYHFIPQAPHLQGRREPQQRSTNTSGGDYRLTAGSQGRLAPLLDAVSDALSSAFEALTRRPAGLVAATGVAFRTDQLLLA
jgi:hypothetical protein